MRSHVSREHKGKFVEEIIIGNSIKKALKYEDMWANFWYAPCGRCGFIYGILFIYKGMGCNKETIQAIYVNE